MIDKRMSPEITVFSEKRQFYEYKLSADPVLTTFSIESVTKKP